MFIREIAEVNCKARQEIDFAARRTFLGGIHSIFKSMVVVESSLVEREEMNCRGEKVIKVIIGAYLRKGMKVEPVSYTHLTLPTKA